MIDQIISLFTMLVVVGFVIFLAYFTTIVIGRKTNNLLKNPSIRVLEKSNIGMQVSITITQIGSKVYILANQGKQLVVLDTIDAEEWHENSLKTYETLGNQQPLIPLPMEALLKKLKVRTKFFPKKGDEDCTDE